MSEVTWKLGEKYADKASGRFAYLKPGGGFIRRANRDMACREAKRIARHETEPIPVFDPDGYVILIA